MKKTLSFILSALMGGIVAFALTGCTTGPEKVVAKFSVGERVAFTHSIVVDVSAYRFVVEVGDTGVINEVEYLVGDANMVIRYCVLLDKGADKGWEAHAFQTRTGNTVWDGWLEAVVYPDPALAPRK